MGKQNYAKALHESKQYRSHTLHLGPNRAQRRAQARAGLIKPGYSQIANNPYRKQPDGSLGPSAA